MLAAAVLLASVPMAVGAPSHTVAPGQRIDLKVLLVSADGTEPGFGAWKAELEREGVPYSTFVAYNGQAKAASLTDDTLADYAGDHAKYSAVILAGGDLGHNVTNPDTTVSFLSAFTDAEWAALAKFERTFGARQLSDYTAPTPAHGLQTVGGTVQDGLSGTLTAAGKSAFPYLKGPVPIANDDPAVGEAFGYQATPVTPADWQTLVAAPNNSAYLGIYTHPDDGRQEMVMTVASNQFQSHNQLLRHGMLNWVTRGVFLGYQRNYLALHVDDLFLGDDAWNPTTNVTDFDPTTASRMTPSDVDQARAWSKARGIRLDFAYNGGGSELYKQAEAEAGRPASDPLANKFADPEVRNSFGYINHTYDHPNVDCSTASFITKELRDNQAWANSHDLPVSSPSETITGEHSGVANSRPGNPGKLDPPVFDDVDAQAGGAVPAGSYDYALTASVPATATLPAGETTASTVTSVAVVAPSTAVRVTFNALCHATSYSLYRAPTGTTSWAKVGTLARAADARTDDGAAPVVLTINDTLAAGTAGVPPATNGAALAPYSQNPQYLKGVTDAGIKFVGTDASKGYPADPFNVSGTLLPAGATFFEGTAAAGFQAVPRYPSNVYYNVSKQSQQLDEYNYIYTAPGGTTGGNCVAIPGTTTCRNAPANWTEYVTSEDNIMFRHLMGNDPRPGFAHQSNLADYDPALPETDPNQGGVLYPVYDGLLQRYEALFDRASEPLVQPTMSQTAATLVQQDTWAADLGSGTVTAYLQDGRVHVKNAGPAAVDVPLTGTTVGELYGGQKSGWTSLPAGAEQTYAPNDPANTAAPTVSGTLKVGAKLIADNGTWTGTPTIGFSHQWQRCSANGANCARIVGETSADYVIAPTDVGSTLRVVVTAGNWISSVNQAASAVTEIVPQPADSQTASGGKPNTKSGAGVEHAVRLALTKLRMSPRRFAVAHRTRQQGTRLDGSRITWRLNQRATVHLKFQRRAGSRKHRRWVTVGTIKRASGAGAGVVRFTGRFGRKRLSPHSYLLVVTATRGRAHSAAKQVHFTVKR
jgi:hypothetical protein